MLPKYKGLSRPNAYRNGHRMPFDRYKQVQQQLHRRPRVSLRSGTRASHTATGLDKGPQIPSYLAVAYRDEDVEVT